MISIIIPAKNEAESLQYVLPELIQSCKKLPCTYEIIIVNGHSTDATIAIAEQFSCILVEQVETGYGDAVNLGIKKAVGDFIIFFDADGSYDPDKISELYLNIQDCDAVFCSRYSIGASSDDDTWIRFIGNKFFTLLMHIFFSVHLSDALFLYAIIRKEKLILLPMQSKRFDWCIELPIRVEAAKLRYKEIAAHERSRLAGISKVNALADGFQILFSIIKIRFTR